MGVGVGVGGGGVVPPAGLDGVVVFGDGDAVGLGEGLGLAFS